MLKAIQNELDRRGFRKRWRVRPARNSDGELEWYMPIRGDKPGEAYPLSDSVMAVYTTRRLLALKVAKEIPGVEIFVEGDWEVVLHVPNEGFETLATRIGVMQRRPASPGNLDALQKINKPCTQSTKTDQFATQTPEVA